MRNYRLNQMTDLQKARYKEVNRKTAAANRLKKKVDSCLAKQKNKERQQKCRLLKQIPDSPSKFRKVVQTVAKVAEKSPKKMMILQDVLSTFKSVASQSRVNNNRVSVLHLQFLKSRNRVKEHTTCVQNLLKQFRSMRKASIKLGVPYKTLYRLCQPPVVRQKQMQQVWTDIRNFYQSNIVPHELPSAKCKGRWFLSITLEECFVVYKEGCVRQGKNNVSFSTFCHLRPRSVFKVDQTPNCQCICEQCENFRLVKNQLIKVGVRGIPAHMTDCIKMSLCKIDSDSDRNDCENDRFDSFH